MIHIGDVQEILPTLESESINCVVTSPPYWGLRDYGVEGQLGLEKTPEEYIANMVAVFREVRRILRKDGTCWVNIGDSYVNFGGSGKQGATGQRASRTFTAESAGAQATKPDGLKPKDLCLIPFRLALAIQADGWYVRSHIIWAKKSPMPESVTDRPTSAHESIFLLTKSPRYWYDADAVREPHSREWWHETVGKGYITPEQGRNDGGKRQGNGTEAGANLRNVWRLGPEPFPEAHFATFPSEIPRRCILAGCPKDGTVLDPFMGSGTTAMVAQELGRKWAGIELNPEYAKMVDQRARQYGWAI